MDNTTNKRPALLVATLVSFITPFMGSSINIALPSIAKEFSMDAVLLSWVTTSFLLATAVSLVPFGRIADIQGRKRVLKYGTIIYTIASLLSAISPSATALISFRVLQGIGGAMIYCTGIAILTSVFPMGERGKALGISVAATYVGLSLGPPLGGLLTQYFGWRSIFLANVPLGIITIALIFWKLKGEWAEAKGAKFDFTGSIIYGLALIAVMYGLSIMPAISGVWLIVIGISGILIFIKWEMRQESPILNINLFKDNTVFTFSNLTALIHYAATYAVFFFLSLYLQYIKGFNPGYAGIILISQPLAMAVLSPVAGRLSDRLDPRSVASIGMALTTVGLILLIFLNESTSLGFIIAILVLTGTGCAAFSSPNINAVMSSVDKNSYGVASAILATMRQSGQMLSMGITMLILAIYMGRLQITPESYQLFLKSMQTAFIISAVLCFCGIFTSLARGKTR